MKALSENGTHASLCNPEMIQAIFELERRRQKALTAAQEIGRAHV